MPIPTAEILYCMKKNVGILLSFLLATLLVCIGNFVLQILLIFLDIATRLDSSSLMVIVLWIVTGVFATVFTKGIAELVAGADTTYRQTSTIVLIIAVLAIAVAVTGLSRGLFRRSPEEFSLLFSNGWVFISYFAGAAGMALIMRKLD